jgi:hypothetical protein
MLLKIVCLLMRWLFGLTVLVFRGDGAKNAELLVLRHEKGPGAPPSRSRSPPSNTSTGTTTGGSTKPAVTFPRRASVACWKLFYALLSGTMEHVSCSCSDLA